MIASTLSCSAFSVATHKFCRAQCLSNPSPSAYRALPSRIFVRSRRGGALEKQPGTALDTMHELEYHTSRRMQHILRNSAICQLLLLGCRSMVGLPTLD